MQATKLGTYEKFRVALKASFSSALQSICASPVGQRDYVIVTDFTNKSSNWAIAHLHELMAVHPPTDIVGWSKIGAFLGGHKQVSHIVFVDDGVYSGSQASINIKECGLQGNHKFHVAIPYMTLYGKKKVSDTLAEKNCQYQLHDRQTMHSYDELVNIGKIFSRTGKMLVNTKLIKRIKLLPNLNNSPIKSKVNHKIEELLLVIKLNKPGSEVYEKVMETISMIDNHCIELNKQRSNTKEIQPILRSQNEQEVLLSDLVQLMNRLFKAMSMELSSSQNKSLQAAYLGQRWLGGAGLRKDKTATWFAHKGADDVSTNYEEMKIIVGRAPLEPYSRNIGRAMLLEVIKVKMGETTLENTLFKTYPQLKGMIDFVHTNRGYFLLGNSYIKDIYDDTSPIKLQINGKKIELGGKEGEYQYQIKVGDTINLEDPQTYEKISLTLDTSGQLSKI